MDDSDLKGVRRAIFALLEIQLYISHLGVSVKLPGFTPASADAPALSISDISAFLFVVLCYFGWRLRNLSIVTQASAVPETSERSHLKEIVQEASLVRGELQSGVIIPLDRVLDRVPTVTDALGKFLAQYEKADEVRRSVQREHVYFDRMQEDSWIEWIGKARSDIERAAFQAQELSLALQHFPAENLKMSVARLSRAETNLGKGLTVERQDSRFTMAVTWLVLGTAMWLAFWRIDPADISHALRSLFWSEGLQRFVSSLAQL